LFKQHGTTLKMSSNYHPQTDGQSEVVNKCLENYLRCFTQDRPKQWLMWSPWAEFWYNTTWHSSIKMTPYEAVDASLLQNFCPMFLVLRTWL
jgi:hypothetical protein